MKSNWNEFNVRVSCGEMISINIMKLSHVASVSNTPTCYFQIKLEILHSFSAETFAKAASVL